VSGDILALDVGTSVLKVGVFSPALEQLAGTQRTYAPRVNDQGWADIEPDAWWSAIRDACAELRSDLAGVDVVAPSVTTPGLTAIDADGSALAPAILFFDGRSSEQAARIRGLVGEDDFLRETCNLPVSGGSSLASILWLREQRPDVWARAARFGHCNTYLVGRLTGRWAIDPSTTSITGLYNTAANDLTWNRRVLDLAGIGMDQLPQLLPSHAPVGRVTESAAAELGLPRRPVVLCGGNDAVLAALSGGVTEPGDVTIISGTCDIASVCIDRPIGAADFNVRCHVVPDRWLTFFVLNAGGEALAWFHRTLCPDLDEGTFYGDYVPGVVRRFLADPAADAREAALPGYVPYLAGSRYSLQRRTASLDGLSVATTRDDILLSIVRGNFAYLGDNLRTVGRLVPLNHRASISGGPAAIPGMLAARRRWTGDFDYVLRPQSSLLGAAMLGQLYQSEVATPGDAAVRTSMEAV
jgi:xylulokinase